MRAAAFAWVLTCSIGRTVLAQQTPPSDPPAIGAPELAAEGVTLSKKGLWAEAFAKFETAERLEHSPVVVLYMARCKRELGQLREARSLFDRVAREVLREDASDKWHKAVVDARDERERVEREIPTVILDASGPRAGEVVLTLDGAIARRDAVIEIDPGSHRADARIGSRVLKSIELTIAPREKRRRIVLELAEIAKPKAVAVPPGSRTPGVVTVSIGGATLVTGAITGAAALALQSAIAARCSNDACLEEDRAKKDTVVALSHASTAGLVIGGVASAVGIGLIVARPRIGKSAGSLTLVGGFARNASFAARWHF
jgi:hypothetical protein